VVLAQQVQRWTVNRAIGLDSPDGCRSLSLWLIMKSFLRSLTLVSALQKFQFLAKVKATSTGKLLDSLPRKMRWLNCALVNSMWLTVMIGSENYHHNHHGVQPQLQHTKSLERYKIVFWYSCHVFFFSIILAWIWKNEKSQYVQVLESKL
jgi:hypothetical protein